MFEVEFGDLFLQVCILGQIGPHLSVSGKGRGWRSCHLPHPAAQNALGHIQVRGGLRHRNADGTFPDTSRDFVGQGAANIAGSVFGAIPAGGSMSGTAVTVQEGAQSRWANIFGGLFIIFIIFLLVDVVKLVPMAALGGLLLVVGLQNIQPAEVRLVWQTGTAAKVAMAATLLATLILPLQFAILFGVAISFLLLVLRSANRVEVRELVPVEGGFPVEHPAPSTLETRSITVLRIRGSLFFASAQSLGAQLPKASTASHAIVILALRDMDDLGSTVIRLLKRYASDLERCGGRLFLAGVNGELRGQLDRTGFAAQIGADAIFEERPEIGMALNEAIMAARERIEAASDEDGDRP